MQMDEHPAGRDSGTDKAFALLYSTLVSILLLCVIDILLLVVSCLSSIAFIFLEEKRVESVIPLVLHQSMTPPLFNNTCRCQDGWIRAWPKGWGNSYKWAVGVVYP
jgi:hypothetical protein